RADGPFMISGIETTGLVTLATLNQWIPPGRVLGLPGTWRAKVLLQRALLNTVFTMSRQLKQLVSRADVAYFAWPYMLAVPETTTPKVVTVHDLLWKIVPHGTTDEDKR